MNKLGDILFDLQFSTQRERSMLARSLASQLAGSMQTPQLQSLIEISDGNSTMRILSTTASPVDYGFCGVPKTPRLVGLPKSSSSATCRYNDAGYCRYKHCACDYERR